MTDWITTAFGNRPTDGTIRTALKNLKPGMVPAGSVLFRPGDAVGGFVLVTSGEVGVYLTGHGGREVLLYAVRPGETCVQTTLGLMGEGDYAGEAICETDTEIVQVPRATFTRLMDGSAPFRDFVFHAFAHRLQSMTALLERLAFMKIEERLAELLLDRADGTDRVHNTHQGLATAIGSAREVVSRRLEQFSRQGLVKLERGVVQIIDRSGLEKISAKPGPV